MIKEFETYINESWFIKKTFEDRIEQIDELFIKYESVSGKAVGDKHDSAYSKAEHSRYLNKSLAYMADTTDILNDTLIKFGRKLTQEQLDQLVKRFNTVEDYIGGTGWILKDYSYLRQIRESENSILNILHHLKEFYGMKVDVPEKRFKNPLVFFKEDGYYYIVHQSYVDKKEKEAKEKHSKDDPYGEEEWVEEK